MASALESSHTHKRDVKRWQLLWTECVSGQSPAFTLYTFSESRKSHFSEQRCYKNFCSLKSILKIL